MRIVAGRFKGRALAAPAGMATRPTADRVRQALFNIVMHGDVDLTGAHVLDVFAGSGAIGLEALSRGAAHATFIENGRAAVSVLADNVSALGVGAATTLLPVDATRPPPAAVSCDLVFLDPPYGSGLAGPALRSLRRQGWVAADGMAVIEVAAGEPFASPWADWAIADQRRYGAARLVFLRPTGGGLR